MRVTLSLLLMLAMAPASAGWELTSMTTAGDSIYLDPTTIRRNGTIRRVWALTNLKQRDPQDGEMSRRSLVEYDCKEERTRTIQQTLHAEQNALGNVIRTSNLPGAWEFIAPGTIGDTALKFVCSR